MVHVPMAHGLEKATVGPSAKVHKATVRLKVPRRRGQASAAVQVLQPHHLYIQSGGALCRVRVLDRA